MVESQQENQQKLNIDSTVQMLLDAQKDGSYEKATRYQIIDFDKLKGELESKETVEEQMKLLKYHYTCLYLLVNKIRGVEDEEFREWCKSCLDDCELMVYYI